MIEDARRRLWIANSNVPVRFKDRLPADLDFKIEGKPGIDSNIGLLLHGAPGVGKTTIAAALVNQYVQEVPRGSLPMSARWPGLFLRYPELLRIQKLSWDDDQRSNDLIRGLYFDHPLPEYRVHLLVIDDIGKEQKTEWSESQIDHILRARFDAGVTTVVTTNLPPEEWITRYDPALASFIQEAFVFIEVKGKDRRARR